MSALMYDYTAEDIKPVVRFNGNGMVGGEGREFDRYALTSLGWNTEVAKQLRTITASDVLDELTECEESLQKAIERADVQAIGRIVIAVRYAYAERLANQSLGTNYKVWSAEQAAKEVL
jgi:hypothetical protein